MRLKRRRQWNETGLKGKCLALWCVRSHPEKRSAGCFKIPAKFWSALQKWSWQRPVAVTDLITVSCDRDCIILDRRKLLKGETRKINKDWLKTWDPSIRL